MQGAVRGRLSGDLTAGLAGGSKGRDVGGDGKGARLNVEKMIAVLSKLDRWLLGVYLIALFGLLLFPIGGSRIQLLGIGADKWMHAALFGGLAIFLRWNLGARRHAVPLSIGLAFVVAFASEAAQGLVSYRSAEWWDLVADLVGATLGALSMNRLVASPFPEKSVGLLVAVLGVMVATFFVLADVIGVGETNYFGRKQMAGTALGALITLGGIAVYLRGLNGESCP